MFYDLFYNLFAELLGETALATAQGQLFATYGSYIFVIICIVAVIQIGKALVNWAYSLFK